MPAIVSDIDGVVIRAKDNIAGSKEAIEKVLSPVPKTQRKVPFTFMSNGGGCFEYEKAKKLNS